MEPEKNIPENNLNTPQVGPLPEPLPPEPIPPAPVVPEPTPELTPAPTPAPEPTPESTPTPTPEPALTEPTPTQTAPTPERPKLKKESNKNNYILAGVSIGIIAIIIVLIVGGFLGWFGNIFGGSLFGTMFEGDSDDSGLNIDISKLNPITNGVKEVSDSEPNNTLMFSYNQEKASELKDALLGYMTNNMGNLPTITPDYDDTEIEFELDVTGYASTPANQFYNSYLEDFIDYNNNDYHLHFYSDYEGSYYERHPEDIAGRSTNEMIIFYNSECTGTGGVVLSSNSRSFAIAISDPVSSSGIYCIDNQ